MAQATITKIEHPTISVVISFSTSHRGTKGFGSTDKPPPPTNIPVPHPETILQQHAASAAIAKKTEMTRDAHQIHLSTNPYDNCISITLPAHRGKDNAKEKDFGFSITTCPHRNLSILTECRKSTHAARIIRWRSTIKGAYIMEVNGIPVDSTDKCLKLLKQCHDHDETPIITFRIMDRASLHPHKGVPMIYFDQLQLIGRHLHKLKMNAYLE